MSGEAGPIGALPQDQYEVCDPAAAKARADELRPQCQTWLRRARKLFKDLPKGTRIYWEGDSGMCLMALAEDGRPFIHRRGGGGEEQQAMIASIQVPGSDCGGW